MEVVSSELTPLVYLNCRQVARLNRLGLIWRLGQRRHSCCLPAGSDARSVRDLELIVSLVDLGLAAIDDSSLALDPDADALPALTPAASIEAAAPAASQSGWNEQQRQQRRQRHQPDA